LKWTNKLEKANLQTFHLVTILESFMSAAVPRNVAAAFKNGGISLRMNPERTVRCSITPETSQCVIGLPFRDALIEPAQEEGAEEEAEEE
jgi:hypothetical protein